MATAKKTTARKKPAAKSRAKRPVARKSAAASQEQYSNTTWGLVIGWLVLILIFLGLVIFKLY